jgi:hypothetical protein
MLSDSAKTIPTPSVERRVFCPECGIKLSLAGQGEHLVAAHGYVPLFGTLLPLPTALRCLWDRVLATGDTDAHERICRLLERVSPHSEGLPPYVATLAEELEQRFGKGGLPSGDRTRLVERLRSSLVARPLFRQLLVAPDPRMRNLGRELVLPEAGAALASQQTTAEDVRQWLDQLCSNDDVWTKIEVCQRLPAAGAAKAAVRDCLRQLQGERPVACPECDSAVPQEDLDEHLRHSHRVYQFRGVRRPLQETIAALLAAVCDPKPDFQAWESLEALARDEYGTQAEAILAAGLEDTLRAIKVPSRGELLSAVAEVLGASTLGAALATRLASSSRSAARHLALLTVIRLHPPLPSSLVLAAQPLLARKAAVGKVQIAAARALLATTENADGAALEIVNALVARCNKHRALDRLQRLQQLVGATPVLLERMAQIESRIRMRCPRCRVQFRRPEMMRHLWTEHTLLLDGRRVRRPWRMLEEWIDDYQLRSQPEVLARCRALGQHLDPEHGLHRVYRLLLARGVDDGESRQVLSAEARQNHATLCPRCFTQVPAPPEIVPRSLNASHGRLSLDEYSVELVDHGLFPRLTVRTPTAVVYQGREPGRLLTRQGAILALAGPVVLGAMLLAALMRFWGEMPRQPVVLLLMTGLLLYIVVRIREGLRPRAVDRAVDHAWQELVPRLHAGAYSVEDGRFLAGLALTSARHGKSERRAAHLMRMIQLTENAAAGGLCPIVYLAALIRLRSSDLARTGGDPVPLLADEIGLCFEGKRPLSFAQSLLADSHEDWWTTRFQARLRVLLCDRAFEAGLELRELREAGRTAPALGEVLQGSQPAGLAQLRLLWSMRASRPWDRWSTPATVFDLAAAPVSGGDLFDDHPDLLLLDRQSPPILVCGHGVKFEKALISEMPARIEVKHLRDGRRSDYEVIVGEQRFLFTRDPANVVRRLEAWLHHYFNEFVPRTGAVFTWEAPQGRKILHLRESISCPGCGQAFVPRLGEAGTPVPN